MMEPVLWVFSESPRYWEGSAFVLVYLMFYAYTPCGLGSHAHACKLASLSLRYKSWANGKQIPIYCTCVTQFSVITSGMGWFNRWSIFTWNRFSWSHPQAIFVSHSYLMSLYGKYCICQLLILLANMSSSAFECRGGYCRRKVHLLQVVTLTSSCRWDWSAAFLQVFWISPFTWEPSF